MAEEHNGGVRITSREIYAELQSLKADLAQVRVDVAVIREHLDGLDRLKAAAYDARRAVDAHERAIAELRQQQESFGRWLLGSLMSALLALVGWLVGLLREGGR